MGMWILLLTVDPPAETVRSTPPMHCHELESDLSLYHSSRHRILRFGAYSLELITHRCFVFLVPSHPPSILSLTCVAEVSLERL